MGAIRIAAMLALALAMAACATRPINPSIQHVDRSAGYRYQTRQQYDDDKENLVVLAFSGGGTRAAAFSYGVLEELRRTEVVGPLGKRRLLDEVDIVTGVSGGSFTALAYGLYGEKLFDEYEKRFLKRNVQGNLITQLFNPKRWSSLWSDGWGRSELAAEMYDEYLFEGATFGDLNRRPGPLIIASATDISTGSRLAFIQTDFDLLCSNLESVPLSRAAAASSAVPLVLSPVTLNNYGGTCGFQWPRWAQMMKDPKASARPAGRALQRLREMEAFQDSKHRPYIHLVDGGVADNLGMRSILEALEELEAMRAAGRATRLDKVRRIIVLVVNSLSSPKTNWDASPRPPNDLAILLKAAGVPIDRYSYEAVELLKDIVARWRALRRLRESGVFAPGANESLKELVDAPDIDIYAIDVSFAALKDKAEVEYLNDLPTSFVLPDEAVDRLRRAAGVIIRESPEFRRLLQDVGVTLAER
ncbi:MAG TPA: patatin-like phospholipase family protein [Rhodocyclaceae bacterium]|nr:patatin-like phospholipase family protein [Rhodocyclaceae bacterium]